MRVIHLHCPRCCYDLFAGRYGTCPECGERINRRELAAELRSNQRTAIKTILMLCVPAFIMIAMILPALVGRFVTTDRELLAALHAGLPTGVFVALLAAGLMASLFARTILWSISVGRGRRSRTSVHVALWVFVFVLQVMLAVFATIAVGALAATGIGFG